jgi:hypothetical protein
MMENNELKAMSEEDFLHMLYALGYIATDADLEAMQESARTVPASNPKKPMNVIKDSSNVNDI